MFCCLIAGEYFKKSQCFLYTYLFVHPDVEKGVGVGRKVANAAWKVARRREEEGLIVRGIFGEFELPDAQLTDDLDPLSRLRIMHRLGIRQVGVPPVPYFQPPLKWADTAQQGADAIRALAEAKKEHCPLLLGMVVTQRTDRDESNGQPWVSAAVVL